MIFKNGTYTSVFDGANSRIGLGTSAPDTPLHFYNVNLGDLSQIKWENAGNDVNSGIKHSFFASGNEAANIIGEIYNVTGSDKGRLRFQTGTNGSMSNRMTINESGVITFSNYSTGVLHSSAGGILTSSSITTGDMVLTGTLSEFVIPVMGSTTLENSSIEDTGTDINIGSIIGGRTVNTYGAIVLINASDPFATANTAKLFATDYAAGDSRLHLRGESGNTMIFGNQEIIGGTAASDNLTLTSTSNATKGNIVISDDMSLEDNDITNVGNIALDSLTSDSGAGGTITVSDATISLAQTADEARWLQFSGTVETTSNNSFFAIQAVPNIDPTVAITGARAIYALNLNTRLGGSASAGVSNVASISTRLFLDDTYSGTIDSFYGLLYTNASILSSGSPTLTDQYGVYVGDLTTATNNYAFYSAVDTGNWAFYGAGTGESYFGGNVEINGGASIGTEILTLDQDDADKPFIDFQGSTGSDTTSSISTLTTSGSPTHHIQIEINGTKAWVPASTTDPS